MAGLGIGTLAGLLVSVMRLWSIAAAAVVGLLILAAGWLVLVLRLVVACKSAQQLQEAQRNGAVGVWTAYGWIGRLSRIAVVGACCSTTAAPAAVLWLLRSALAVASAAAAVGVVLV
jgi:hypothetical protein